MPQNEKIDNDSFPQRFNPIARRWDSVGSLDVENPTENNGWIEIEDGIEVKFKNIDDIIIVRQETIGPSQHELRRLI